jgi:hypothetical protein
MNDGTEAIKKMQEQNQTADAKSALIAAGVCGVDLIGCLFQESVLFVHACIANVRFVCFYLLTIT